MEMVCCSYGKGMQQLWKRYAAAMEKVCSSYGKVCSSYGKGMQQLWKRYAAVMEKYTVAMEKVCSSEMDAAAIERCVEVTNLGIVRKPYKDERKLRGNTHLQHSKIECNCR